MDMLITGIPNLCIDKRKYDALIGRFPLASQAFDASLSTPSHRIRLHDGLLSLSDFGNMDRETAMAAQGEVIQYSSNVFDLSPIFHAAIRHKGNLATELEMLSSYDVLVSDYHESARTPYKDATKSFTRDELDRLNEEKRTKQKELPRNRRKNQPTGYNHDARYLRELASTITSKELTSNPYGSAVPTLRLVDPRYALLLLTSDDYALNSTFDKHKLGALNIVAQLLIDLYKDIQQSLQFDDSFKNKLKVINQIRGVVKPFIDDPNERLSTNANAVYTLASSISDEGLKLITQFSELTKSKEDEIAPKN